MLTVIREMAEAAESPEARELDRLELLTLIVARGEESLARTPELLAVLEGGRGRRRRRRRAARDHPRRAGRGRRGARARGARRHGDALARGDAPGALGVPLLHRVRDRGRSGSTPTGSSASSSGSATRSSSSATRRALKVHVHTDDPGAALSLGTASGTIDGVEIADMHRQTLEREERLDGRIAGGPPDARDGDRGRRARRGEPPPLREPAGDARDRRRADDEPVHRGDRGRGRRDARRPR